MIHMHYNHFVTAIFSGLIRCRGIRILPWIWLPLFASFEYEYISFDDLVPSGRTMTQCWDHIGMDDQERIYIGFTSSCSDGLEDVCMFRYNPETEKREFLGTFMGAAKDAGNYQTGESIPKGHTDIVNIGGILYMGSQGFHDWKNEIYTTSPNLNDYRGGHIYTFNSKTDKWDDVSKDLPGGVVVEHEGIVCLEYMPWNNLLVGLTHPLSNIVLFDYTSNKVTKVVTGIPWKLGNPVSREIVVTKTGKIYLYRGTEPPDKRNQSFNVWVYTLATDSLSETGFTCSNGFWDGQAKTRDGNHIYISSCNGNVYHLDVVQDKWESLGHFLPAAEYEKGTRLTYLYGICLSPDERTIYGIASMAENTQLTGNLYAFDRSSGSVSFIQKVGGTGCYTGNDVRDSRGNIYFARHGNEGDGWNRNCRLLKITVSDPVAGMKHTTYRTSGSALSVQGHLRSYTCTLNGRRVDDLQRTACPAPLKNRVLITKKAPY